MKSIFRSTTQNRRHRQIQPEQQGEEQTFFSQTGQHTQNSKPKPFFQAKLTVGKPGDTYEREADAVADAVVNHNAGQQPVVQRQPITPVGSAGGLQRLATPDEEKMPSTNDARMEEDKAIQEKPIQKMEGPEEEELLQGKAEKEEEEPVQMQAAPEEEEMAQTKPEEEEEPVQMQAVPEEEEMAQTKPEEEEEPVQMQPEEEEEPVQMQAQEEEEPVQMQAAPEEEEEPVQAKSQPGAKPARADLSSRLSQRRGNGKPLPKSVKSQMEHSFGVDFSGVNIHTDTEAVQLNRDLSAQAFTHGQDVYFNSGKFNPEHTEGKRLLAHELTHVVQQGGAGIQPVIQRKLGDGHDLKSARFSGNERLENTYDNEAVVKKWTQGTHVLLIQEALLELGYELPDYGPDEKFGSETKKAVIEFQKDNGLNPDGVVGFKTLNALDDKFQQAKPEEKPEISTTAKDLGHHVAAGIIKANEDVKTETSGIHYAHNFKKNHPDIWKESYRDGYANPKYWERLGFMDWRLKKGVSASEAIKDWLQGLTIAECLSTINAVQTDTLRAALGDRKFDELFGSIGKSLPEEKRLRVGVNISSVDEFLVKTESSKKNEAGGINKRPVKEGEWYYFYNHPQYLLKHPKGAFQGENSIYLGLDTSGNQRWSGLGLHNVTEVEMYESMKSDYNYARTPWDNEFLNNLKIANHGILPAEYDLNSGIFPDKINKWQDILTAAEYTIDGEKRKGGFVADSGWVLESTKIEDAKKI